jgi:hypothetical protein
MDLAALLYVVSATERHLLFLVQGLLLVVSTVSVILAISSVDRVDFPVFLLLLSAPLAMRLKKSSLGFGSLNTCVCDREQIDHRLGLLHGNLLHGLDVLDVWDSVPDIAEMFHVVLEALIMLLLDGLQSLSNIWLLIHALKVPDEHGT